jgi:DNA polymerase III subunit delta
VSAHLVKGEDPILRSDAAELLIGELLGSDDRTLALEDSTVPAKGSGEGDGGGSDARVAVVDATLNGASTPPFMTESRVVVLREVGLLTAAEVEPICRYLDDPLPTTELVLVAGGGALPKSLESAVKKHGTVHTPGATKASDVLAQELASADLRLRPDATKTLLAHVGGDAGLLPGIVETLAGAYGPDAQLDGAAIAPYLGGEGSIPVWDLTNAIEKGDAANALTVLHRLLTVTSPTQPKPAHPLQVVAILHSHYRRLLKLDDPEIRSAEDAAAVLGGRTNPSSARYRLKQARGLGTDGLRQAFDHLARADLDLKGERAIPGDAVLDVLVVRLCGLSARGGRG